LDCVTPDGRVPVGPVPPHRCLEGPGQDGVDAADGALGHGFAGGAGGARTYDRRIMRSMASCTMRPSCTDGTSYRTDGTCRAGIN